MAINTYGSYLMHSADGVAYTKLLDIKDYPDMIEAPEQLDATTLSDSMRVYIPGIKGTNGAMEFTANYSAADFTAVQALEGTEGYFAVWFGENAGTPDGSKGKFSFKGYPYASKSGNGVNEVSDMKVGIIPSTKITFAAS